MKNWIKEDIAYWINTTALVFTAVMILNLVMGYDIDNQQVKGTLIVCVVLGIIGLIVWENSRISMKWKYIIQYSVSFIVCIILNGVLWSFEIFSNWGIKHWALFWFQFTAIYVLLCWYAIWRNKIRAKRLNQRLEEFKKDYQ